jgi:hypothetical protein
MKKPTELRKYVRIVSLLIHVHDMDAGLVGFARFWSEGRQDF